MAEKTSKSIVLPSGTQLGIWQLISESSNVYIDMLANVNICDPLLEKRKENRTPNKKLKPNAY